MLKKINGKRRQEAKQGEFRKMLAATAEKTKRGWGTRRERSRGRGRQRMLAQFAVSVLAHDEADDDDRTQLNSTQTELRVGERGGSRGRERL